MVILRARFGDRAYEEAARLRERDLLAQVGMTLADYRRQFSGLDEGGEHLVAVDDAGRVVGSVTLVDEGDGRGRLTQMVVDRDLRGCGIGRQLVAALVARAMERGMREVSCHARREAYGFYARLGWVFDGDAFEEAGIEHRVMRFVLGGEDGGALCGEQA